MKVLLLEDEVHVRRALARSLEAWGHQVIEVDSVERARAALTSLPMDLLVLDVNLPDATGWDLLRSLVEEGQRSPPAIVISAIQPSLTRVHEFQPIGVLNKPFPIESLRRMVNDIQQCQTDGITNSTTPVGAQEKDA